MSTDGEVTLDERIWLHKLCDHNSQAMELTENLLEWEMLF